MVPQPIGFCAVRPFPDDPACRLANNGKAFLGKHRTVESFIKIKKGGRSK